MCVHQRSQLGESSVTAESALQQGRRRVLSTAFALGAAYGAAGATRWARGQTVSGVGGESLSPLEALSSYNNYYEFSTDKQAVQVLSQALTLAPWSLTVDGEVERPFRVDLDDLRRLFGHEERIYRMRCVEGWSAVVPWSGFALAKLLARARPTSRARYVAFDSLQRSSEMIGQRMASLPWPYREGLRIDEAMHPLAFLATGLYGHPLPKQNGAPVRLVMPWKYGFKSAKAIVQIRLLAQQPTTSWHQYAPSEYGFYGNVNPLVPHPRWSQARESPLGELHKRPTLPFNGYAESVASLYQGQDPKALY